MPTIQKLSDATFRISWEGIPNSSMKLNLSAVIEHFKLDGNFCLLHWQAKPIGLRQWGIYDHASGEYFSRAFDQVNFGLDLSIQTLQIDEIKFPNVRPTAVLYFPSAHVVTDAGIAKIVATQKMESRHADQ